ncbi:MAG: hypothetical protein PUE67_04595 [Oscillospiraceae bacterium]|nr:hypothetical protein [Oscillospiraceae bacterium]
MSIFYPDELLIYGLSINSFIPFNVQDDVLAKVRRNFFEHGKRQSDKIVQNIGEISIKYTYNLERNKPMKWVVQKDKKTIEKSVVSSVNSYEIRTYNNDGVEICSYEFTNDHIFKKATFALDGETVLLMSGKEKGAPVLYYRSNSGNHTLNLLEINEDSTVLQRLSVSNPFITATAFTNRGLVYYGTEEEISNVLSELERIKQEIIKENSPRIYNTQEERDGGFNFKDNDFNLKKNMNETFDIDKTEYFSEDIDDEIDLTNSKSVEESLDELLSEEMINSFEELNTLDEYADVLEKIDISADTDGSDNKEETEQTNDTDEQNNSDEEIKTENEVEETPAEASNNDAYSEELLRKVISQVLAQEEQKTNPVSASQTINNVQNLAEQTDNQPNNSADLIINSGGERYLYYGELNENSLRDGYGRTEMDNGKTAYEGNYKNNRRDGFGSYYYKDGGLCYTGEWKNNKRNGFGLGVRSSDGSYHAGGWTDNKPNGMGVRFDKYGNLSYVSNFKDGKETGLCVEFREDGGISIFKWIDDTKKIIQTIYP